MPPARMTITPGMRFERLTVLRKGTPARYGHPRWDCRCDCGKEVTVRQSMLVAQQTKSCGCLARDLSVARSTKHGMFGTPEYHAWTHMKGRCNSPSHSDYRNYGGRGISVCPAWQSFENFLADMGLRPSPQHSLDRINNDGDYEPLNCRWATVIEQSRNRRTCTFITFDGRTKTAKDWCELLGVPYEIVIRRMAVQKWSFIDAVTTGYKSYRAKGSTAVGR